MNDLDYNDNDNDSDTSIEISKSLSPLNDNVKPFFVIGMMIMNINHLIY